MEDIYRDIPAEWAAYPQAIIRAAWSVVNDFNVQPILNRQYAFHALQSIMKRERVQGHVDYNQIKAFMPHIHAKMAYWIERINRYGWIDAPILDNEPQEANSSQVPSTSNDIHASQHRTNIPVDPFTAGMDEYGDVGYEDLLKLPDAAFDHLRGRVPPKEVWASDDVHMPQSYQGNMATVSPLKASTRDQATPHGLLMVAPPNSYVYSNPRDNNWSLLDQAASEAVDMTNYTAAEKVRLKNAVKCVLCGELAKEAGLRHGFSSQLIGSFVSKARKYLARLQSVQDSRSNS